MDELLFNATNLTAGITNYAQNVPFWAHTHTQVGSLFDTGQLSHCRIVQK